MMNQQSRSAEVLLWLWKNTLQSGHSKQPEKDRKWLISKYVPLGNAGIGFASGCLYSLPPRTLIAWRIMCIDSDCPAPKEKLQKLMGIHSCFGPCVSPHLYLTPASSLPWPFSLLVQLLHCFLLWYYSTSTSCLGCSSLLWLGQFVLPSVSHFKSSSAGCLPWSFSYVGATFSL